MKTRKLSSIIKILGVAMFAFMALLMFPHRTLAATAPSFQPYSEYIDENNHIVMLFDYDPTKNVTVEEKCYYSSTYEYKTTHPVIEKNASSGIIKIISSYTVDEYMNLDINDSRISVTQDDDADVVYLEQYGNECLALETDYHRYCVIHKKASTRIELYSEPIMDEMGHISFSIKHDPSQTPTVGELVFEDGAVGEDFPTVVTDSINGITRIQSDNTVESLMECYDELGIYVSLTDEDCPCGEKMALMFSFYTDDMGKLHYKYLAGGKCLVCNAPDNYEEPTTGWQKNSDGTWMYYNEDGSLAKSTWLLVNGKWYYFNSKGIMTTGWKLVGGKWYYMNSSGAMVTGWQAINGKWYYFNGSGAMQTGWVASGGKWYYMNSSGAMVTGWVQVSGKWYYMNSSGAMQIGWVNVGGKYYYMYSDGHMASSTWIGKYYVNSSGVWTKTRK